MDDIFVLFLFVQFALRALPLDVDAAVLLTLQVSAESLGGGAAVVRPVLLEPGQMLTMTW